MDKNKFAGYRLPDDSYIFDSLKIIQYTTNLRTYLAQLQYYESLKMEFDNGSSFCKHQIRRIVNSCSYKEKYSTLLTAVSAESSLFDFDSSDIFIKDQLLNNPENSWSYFFFSESDYIFFVENLKAFFSRSIYDDVKTMNIKPFSQTKFCNAVHDIYFNLSSDKNLKKDKHFLGLIKNINLFSKLPLYKIHYKLLHY